MVSFRQKDEKTHCKRGLCREDYVDGCLRKFLAFCKKLRRASRIWGGVVVRREWSLVLIEAAKLVPFMTFVYMNVLY